MAKEIANKVVNVELTNWIGTGPSVRARVRLAMSIGFVVVLPILFFSLYQTDQAEHKLDKITTGTVEQQAALKSVLSELGRDQLLLFLILLLSFPVVIAVGPRWVVFPLLRLRRIVQQIGEGRVREMQVNGKDEVAQVAQAVRGALLWREELEQKKSAKIFEVRNVLRTIISFVDEGILILDRDGKMNYVNNSAAQTLGRETHDLEGKMLSEFVFAPELFNAIHKAHAGNSTEAHFDTHIEFQEGLRMEIRAIVGAVYDRSGTVSRVVVVLSPNPVV